MSDLLDWVEQAALENLRGRRANADYLQKEGVTTLTIFLAGCGGGIAYSVKGFESGDLWLAFGGTAFTVYLFILSALLVCKVLKVGSIPALYNEPRHLYQKEYSLPVMREAELKNIQKRITEAVSRNNRVADWLNRLRLLSLLSPLVLASTSGFVWWVERLYAQRSAVECMAALLCRC